MTSRAWAAAFRAGLVVVAAGCGGSGKSTNPDAGAAGSGAIGGVAGGARGGTGGVVAGTGGSGIAGTGGGAVAGGGGGALGGTGGGIAGTGGGAVAGTGGGGGGGTGGGALAGTGGGAVAGSGGAVAGSGGGGIAGTGGVAGSGGAAGATCGPIATGAGGAKTGTPEICTFQIDAALSLTIPTVGVINWSTDLAGLTEARIEFTLNEPAPDTLNRGSGGKIDVTGTTHRALMLGLKAGRTYTYRIVATGAGGQTCTSPDRMLATCTSDKAPTVARTAMNAAAQMRGFIIVTPGVQGISMTRPRAPLLAYIIDADGDVVWWTDAQVETSRALMDWDGATLWTIRTGGGEVRRTSMDGTLIQTTTPGAVGAHHDFAVLPGGTLAFLVPTLDSTGSSDLVERAPDGTTKTVVHLDSKIYKSPNSFHANAIRYHVADDSYTVGDRDAALIIKLTRQGKVLWQLGGSCTGAPAPKCAASALGGSTHGHAMLDNGNLLVFRNSAYQATEYRLTEGATSLSASTVWSYQSAGVGSDYLGDVQRLPNGNTLVTFSTGGQIHEVTPSGAVVQTITANYFGYSNFRETLYGPPLPY